MKKYLLILTSAILVSNAASAQGPKEPSVEKNLIFSDMSSNGKFAAGADPYTYTIYVKNLETKRVSKYEPKTENDMYDLGIGRSVSDNGIVLLSLDFNGTPSYIEDGKIKTLPIPQGITSAYSNSITPDGSRIAGAIGFSMTYDDVIMLRPVIWNRKSDGTYSDPIELPYPKKDFTGRTPQYILVGDISEDGKTIACELHDNKGLIDQPMILTENENGKWTYQMIADDMINPNNIEFPEGSGEAPNALNYMSAEEMAAYEKALNDAKNLVSPVPTDFMSEEARAAYLAILEENPYATISYRDYMTDEEYNNFLAALDEYYKKLNPNPLDFLSPEEAARYAEDYKAWENFDAIYSVVYGESTLFEMNAFKLSLNGRYYTVAGTKKDDATNKMLTKVYVFDLQNSNHLTIKGVDGVTMVVPAFIADDGRILAAKPITKSDPYGQAYYAPAVDADFIPLQDFVKDRSQSLYSFMENNMFHNITESYWDDELEEDVEVTINWITGSPCSNSDMSVIATWALNEWEGQFPSTYIYSYILPMNYGASETRIDDVKENLSIAMDKDGTLCLNGKATSVSVYDVNGRLVFSAKNPSSTIKTGLAKGTYIIKATNGESNAVVKVLI